MSTAKKLIEVLKEEIKSSPDKASDSYMELVELFPLRPITSKERHDVALKVIEKMITFTNATNKKDEGIRVYLETLSELVTDFEKINFKTTTISGRDMLAYLMKLQSLTQKDLAKEIGGQPVVSKILKGERELNLRQIKALAKRFKVSPEVFI